MYPLHTCVPSLSGDGTYTIFSTEPEGSTTQDLLLAIYPTSDCVVSAQGPIQTGVTCPGLTTIPLTGFLTAQSVNPGCGSPSALEGFVSGICYQNMQQETSFKFQSCGKDFASYTLSTYIGTDCSGASDTEVVPYSPLCDMAGALSRCTPGVTAGLSL